jgi:hypothetical protein
MKLYQVLDKSRNRLIGGLRDYFYVFPNATVAVISGLGGYKIPSLTNSIKNKNNGVTNSLAILEDKLLKAYNEVSELKQKSSKLLEYQALLKDRDDYLNSARMILIGEK